MRENHSRFTREPLSLYLIISLSYCLTSFSKLSSLILHRKDIKTDSLKVGETPVIFLRSSREDLDPHVKILPYFSEEMMVQEGPNKLEKKMIA